MTSCPRRMIVATLLTVGVGVGAVAIASATTATPPAPTGHTSLPSSARFHPPTAATMPVPHDRTLSGPMQAYRP
ncbi:hypothetical protein AB4Z55_26230 [Gordonia sp. ABKF26]|uniref:hypothetical protein n=1 Tax=Gordonia sp. ABKF26 TaxID=3238687 RepID=UPI0034E45D5E